LAAFCVLYIFWAVIEFIAARDAEEGSFNWSFIGIFVLPCAVTAALLFVSQASRNNLRT
jgi:hypothetical protein